MIHHAEDDIVLKRDHGDPLVEELSAHGRSVLYTETTGPHCGPLNGAEAAARCSSCRLKSQAIKHAL